MRYLITFSCYGAHLHGEDQGTVDKAHNRFKGPLCPNDQARRFAERSRMEGGEYVLDASARLIVLEAIKEVCVHRNWTLFAAHVRSTHVHTVVESDAVPEKVMNDLKSYSSRRLNRSGEIDRKRWARHGSTRYLYDDQAVRDAVRYVVEQQGTPMALYGAMLI